jgi:hypothetical protein
MRDRPVGLLISFPDFAALHPGYLLNFRNLLAGSYVAENITPIIGLIP